MGVTDKLWDALTTVIKMSDNMVSLKRVAAPESCLADWRVTQSFRSAHVTPARKKNRPVPKAVSGKIGELQRHHALSSSTHETKYGAAIHVEKYENS